MRLDFFSKGDNVLLVGEGNFSFSKCLSQHNLPIAITASCFEKEPQFVKQQENINYLNSKNVPVYFNVDATKLHENPDICGKRFSKIVFNFPHVGGKMKIHLNRQLLREFFESSSRIVDYEGMVLVSLCQGQGGTPADRPRRKWADTWQVTEMAAYGNFVLTAIEPFRFEFFQEYECVGYRSQDVKFNIEGALVYVFLKKKPVLCQLDEDVIKRKSMPVSLAGHPTLFVTSIYSDLYENSPLRNPSSPIVFLKDILVDDLIKIVPGSRMTVLTDESVGICVEGDSGVPCVLDKSKGRFSLREDPSQSFASVLRALGSSVKENEYVFFPGTYFSPASSGSFAKNCPARIKFLILGHDLSEKISKHLLNLGAVFKDFNIVCLLRERKISQKFISEDISLKSTTEVVCKDVRNSECFITATVHLVDFQRKIVEICAFNADCVCDYFFKVKHWAEVWAKENKVSRDGEGIPKLQQVSLYPSTYEFDITLRYITGNKFSERKMREILWCAAGGVVENVKLISDYVSDKDWSSSCYRISYKCLDGPFSRARALELHSKVVGPVLAKGLNVVIC